MIEFVSALATNRAVPWETNVFRVSTSPWHSPRLNLDDFRFLFRPAAIPTEAAIDDPDQVLVGRNDVGQVIDLEDFSRTTAQSDVFQVEAIASCDNLGAHDDVKGAI